MTAADIIEALAIIEAARPANTSPHHVRAAHDTIFVGSIDHWPNLTNGQQVRLDELNVEFNERVNGWEIIL